MFLQHRCTMKGYGSKISLKDEEETFFLHSGSMMSSDPETIGDADHHSEHIYSVSIYAANMVSFGGYTFLCCYLHNNLL